MSRFKKKKKGQTITHLSAGTNAKNDSQRRLEAESSRPKDPRRDFQLRSEFGPAVLKPNRHKETGRSRTHAASQMLHRRVCAATNAAALGLSEEAVGSCTCAIPTEGKSWVEPQQKAALVSQQRKVGVNLFHVTQ